VGAWLADLKCISVSDVNVPAVEDKRSLFKALSFLFHCLLVTYFSHLSFNFYFLSAVFAPNSTRFSSDIGIVI
jgi:hypothetical protein